MWLQAWYVNVAASMMQCALQALAIAIVAFAMLYVRRLYTIEPSKVYRRAMVALQTNPGVLEVGNQHDLYASSAH